MESAYGIAVKNKFELFLEEDEDPLEILRLTEEAKTKDKTVGKDSKGKKNAKNEKDAKASKNKANKKVLTPVQDQKSDLKRDDKPPRAKSRQEGQQRERRPPRDLENRGDQPPRRERREDRPERTDRPGQTSEFRGERPEGGFRGRGRGGGRGRGESRGRGRGGFDRFGKREYERHSGSDKTGIKPVDKREGGGAHNWGTVKDDIESADFNETVTSGEENPNVSLEEGGEERKPAEGETPADGEQPAEPEEEEVKEMTLDEYKAQVAAERAGKSDFKIRKAGEGVDMDAKWKKMYVLSAKKKGDDSDDDEEYEDDEDEHRRQARNTVPIEITFNDARRGGGGRGGGRGRGRGEGRGGGGGRGGFREDRGDRGGGRGGGRGRGGFREDRGARGGGRREQAPDVENELDFPALGS